MSFTTNKQHYKNQAHSGSKKMLLFLSRLRVMLHVLEITFLLYWLLYSGSLCNSEENPYPSSHQ